MMDTQSLNLDEYLREMAKRPRTFGWDAVLVYDRTKTNVLLMQEYIDRFDAESYFPEFEPTCVDLGEGIKHELMGLKMDAPRLSFENANLVESKGRVTIRLVGGKQIQFIETILQGEVIRTPTRLSSLNAIVGPSLVMDINLLAVPGSVDEEGRVILDLANGYEHYLTGVETEFEGTKLGLHFKQLFEKWEAEFTQFQLSELAQSDESVLQPGNFGIRTHAAPTAKVRGSENFGDGAVVLFVAMKGSPNGTYPAADGDMVYMLPSDQSPYSSNLLIGHSFFWKKVVIPELLKLDWLGEGFEEVSLPNTEFTELQARAGGMVPIEGFEDSYYSGGLDPYGIKMTVPDFQLPVVTEGGLRVYLSGSKLKVEWVHDSIGGLASFLMTTNSMPRGATASLKIHVSHLAVYAIKTRMEEGNTVIVLEVESSDTDVELDFVEIEGGEMWNDDLLRAAQEKGTANIMAQLTPMHQQLSKLTVVLDTFRLNNLLFRGNNIVTPRGAYLPGDLALLGDLAPDRTKLIVSPTELVLAGGASHTFTSNSQGTVQWSVESLPGESNDPGTIDSQTGVYQAPSAESLRNDGFRRVIVTARQGDMTSKALVSLVESQVSVYPSVLVASVGRAYSLAAGAADKSALDWAMAGDMLGSLEEDPERDEEVQDGRKYMAPIELPEWGEDDPLIYLGARLDQVVVTPRDGGEPRTIDVLVTANRSPNYFLEAATEGEDSIKLTFYAAGRTGIVEVPADRTYWHKFKGDGTFENGVYTPAPGSTEQYAILAAFDDVSANVPNSYAYMILAVPFVPAQRFINMLHAPEQEV